LAPDPPTFRYRADVLEQLLVLGVRPTPHTRPELVREFVRDLYRHEIRELRAQLLRRAFPKAEYAARVGQLRDRYPVLSLQPPQLVE
jgi:hypothetical protein